MLRPPPPPTPSQRATLLLRSAAADLTAGGRFQCAPVSPFGAMFAVPCGGAPNTPAMHGQSGGALAALLLAAGGAVAAAIIAGAQDNDFDFSGDPVIIRPTHRRAAGEASAAVVRRHRVDVHLAAGSAIKVKFKPTAATRRAIKRALRTHRRVHRTLVITVRDKTHGKTYTVKRKLTFTRPRTASG